MLNWVNPTPPSLREWSRARSWLQNSVKQLWPNNSHQEFMNAYLHQWLNQWLPFWRLFCVIAIVGMVSFPIRSPGIEPHEHCPRTTYWRYKRKCCESSGIRSRDSPQCERCELKLEWLQRLRCAWLTMCVDLCLTEGHSRHLRARAQAGVSL